MGTVISFPDRATPSAEPEVALELPSRTPELALLGAMMRILDQSLGLKCSYDGTKMGFTAAVQHLLREMDEHTDCEEVRKARRFANAIADLRIRRPGGDH